MVDEKVLSLWPPLQQRNQYLSVLSEVSRQPNGAEWLWHPKMVVLYKLVLQNNDISSTSREAAIGALQNITAGEARVGTSHTFVILTVHVHSNIQNEMSDLCHPPPVVISAE